MIGRERDRLPLSSLAPGLVLPSLLLWEPWSTILQLSGGLQVLRLTKGGEVWGTQRLRCLRGTSPSEVSPNADTGEVGGRSNRKRLQGQKSSGEVQTPTTALLPSQELVPGSAAGTHPALLWGPLPLELRPHAPPAFGGTCLLLHCQGGRTTPQSSSLPIWPSWEAM